MKNPFNIGIVLNETDFCDRSKERSDLRQHALNGDNLVLYSPRRFGKSSLVTMVLADLRKEGFLTAYVDLFPISSEEDFVTRFATAVYKGIGSAVDPRSFMEKMKDVFSTLRPVVEMGPEGPLLSARIDRSAGRAQSLDDLMEGVHAYVKKSGVRACIVLDEFQEITELEHAKRVEGTLRSHIQFHKEIAYFFVGSRRRILHDMFNNRARPFYKSAFIYPLGEIPCEDFSAYIVQRFSDSGKSCTPACAKTIYDNVQGYPYYVQKLSSFAWNNTDKECTDAVVHESFRMLVASEAIDFEGMWSALTMLQKSLVKALAAEPTATPYARDYLERYGFTLGGVQKALKVLLARDLIEKTKENIYCLTDPLMGEWLK